MATVGDAYVNIRASGDQLRSDIKKALDGATSDASASGKEAGDAYGDSFASTVAEKVQESLKDAGEGAFEDIVSRASDAAKEVNSSLDGVDSSNVVKQSNQGKSSLKDLALAAIGLGDILDSVGGSGGGSGAFRGVTEAAILADDILRGFGDTARNVGEVINSAFKSGGGGGGFLNWITDGAKDARKWLDTLITAGNFLSAGIFQLIGAIGALLASLFAIGSAVGAAVPSLIALGGVFASLIQGVVAFGIAWQGVSDAIGAGLKTQTKAGQAASRGARSQISNARAIEAAQRALRDAYQRAAESASDSARKVSDAEADLAAAQIKSEQAQKALTAAREAGAESLQQLAFSAEEAALAEESAGISLEKALGRLQAVQSLPPDNRTRREAELAFKEAELNYREAKDRNSDLAKEQEKAAEAGVDGTREVIAAKNDIADADNAVIDAQQRLTDALSEQQKAAAKAAQDIADAIRQLQLAQQAAGAAASTTSGSVNRYKTALADLGPAQQEFVRFIVSLGPLFRTLRAAIGDGLFPPLTSALRELFKNTDSTSFFGMLKSSLSETGAIVGQFLASLVNLMNDPFFKGLFFDIIKNNNKVLQTLGGAFTDIAAALLVVFDAAGPVTQRFADWFAALASGWRDSATGEGALARLTEFFNKAGDAASKVFGVFGAFFDMVMALGKTALPAGITLLDKMTAAFNGLTGEINSNKGGLTKYFNDAAENASVVMDVLGDFTRVLFSFADNPGIKDTANAFRPLAPIIQQIGDAMIKAGPAFARVAVAVGDLILQFVNSGQLEQFFNTFSGILNFVTKLLKTGLGKGLIAVLGFLAAFFIPIRVLGRLFKKVFVGEAGYYISKVQWALEKLGMTKPTENLEKSMRDLAEETNRAVKNIENLINVTGNVEPLPGGGGAGGAGVERSGLKESLRFRGGERTTPSGLIVPAETGTGPFGFSDIDEPGTPARTRARRAAADTRRGAVLGAEVGSAIPGVGTVVGGVVGGAGALAVRGAGALAKAGRAAAERIKSRRRKSSGEEPPRGPSPFKWGDDSGFLDVSAKSRWSKEERAKRGKEPLGTVAKQRLAGARSALKARFSRKDEEDDGDTGKKKRGGGLKKLAALGGGGAAIGAILAVLKNPKIIDEFIGKIVNFASKLPAVIQTVAAKIPVLLQVLVKAIGPIIGTIVKAFPGIIKAIVAELPKLINTIAKALPGVISTIASALPIVIGAIANLLPRIVSAIATALPLVISALAKAFPALIKGLASAIPAILNAIVKALPTIIKAITDALPVIIDAIVTALPIIINAIFTALPQIIVAFANALPMVIGALVKAIPMLIDAIVKAVPLIINGLTKALPMILKAVVGILPAVIKQVVTIFKGSEGLGKIIDWFKELPGKAADFLWKGEDSLLGKIKALPGKITKAAGGMFSGIFNAWASVINGMVEWWNKLELKVGGWKGKFFGREVTFPEVKLSTPDIPWRVPKLAEGGIVNPSRSGTLALLAEAGRPERVTPLDSGGFTRAEREILKTLKDNSEKNMNVQVFVGNQQIEDIVDVKINGKSVRDSRRTNYSRPVN